VPQELVADICKYGGRFEKPMHGVPMERLHEAIAGGIRKINIDTDLRLGITARFREYFASHPGVEQTSEVLAGIKKALDEKLDAVDPRDYLGGVDKGLLRNSPAGTDLEEVMVSLKEWIAGHVQFLVEKFGSAGLAGKVEG